ncbi:signal peptidase I [[Clostridium] polysaccharolyticum]|uniref:Signal peptidase I n=1 Tax=[Clostridium] polysaccharolyticum TaxID=29364 RepID=A0A1I0FJR7_9FIRM|nr:signal peptidase I [[Clostridium] polysaccharolyticum]SET57787.1 signal peptidase I [[Clostridium] polysaccharolyticum]
MSKEDEIRESLELCEDIYVYYEKKEEETGFDSQYKKKETVYPDRKPGQLSGSESDSVPEEQPKLKNHKNVGDEEEEGEAQEKRNFYRREILPVLLCIAIAFAGAKLVSSFLIQITVVQGDSMEATVSDGDKLFVGKLAYKIHGPKRFDVIVFQNKREGNLIKRVIGLPGEKVQIADGIISINGIVLSEDYGFEPMNPDAEPVDMELGEGEYFVLGDNRTVSLDSRNMAIGAVKESEIIGKALIRIYPFKEIRII